MKYYFNFHENGTTSELFRTIQETIFDQAKYQTINPGKTSYRFTIDTKTKQIDIVCMYI